MFRNKVLGLLFLSLASVYGAITVSPNTATIKWVNGLGMGPIPIPITIGGTGGTLNTSCSGANCSLISGNSIWTSFCVAGTEPCCNLLLVSGCTAATSAPAILYLIQALPLTTGTYTFTLTVSSDAGCTGTCTVAVTVQIVDAYTYGISTPSGNQGSCTNTNSFFPTAWKNHCPQETPGDSFTYPAVGGTKTDPDLGGVSTVIAAPITALVHDTVNTDLSHNKTYVSGAVIPGGSMNIIKTDGTGVALSNAHNSGPGQSGFLTAWHWNDDTKYLAFNDNTITVTTVPGNVTTTLYTDPCTTCALTQGGDGEISPDGWWAFWRDTASVDANKHQVCLINLNTVTTWCTDPGTFPVSGAFRNVEISPGINAADNKRYIWLTYCESNGGCPHITFTYTIGDSSLTNLGDLYIGNSWIAPLHGFMTGVSSAATRDSGVNGDQILPVHHCLVDINGIQYLAWATTTYPANIYMVAIRLDAGQAMATPAEVGGGLYHFPVIDDSSAYHFACAAGAPVVVMSIDDAPRLANAAISGQAGLYSLSIVSISNGTPPVVTYADGDTDITNGDTVIPGGVCSTLNENKYTVANLNTGAKTFQLSGAPTVSSCTGQNGNLGGVVSAVGIPQLSNQNDILSINFSNLRTTNTFTVSRLAKSHSFGSRGGSGVICISYNCQAHASVSHDGKLSTYQSNQNGIPDQIRLLVLPTGFIPESGSSLLNLFTFRPTAH